jgi:hypothetical protein
VADLRWPISTAQTRERHNRPELNPDLACQFFEALYSDYFQKAPRLAYIEIRGKRESDKGMTFRRFYLGIDLLIKDMANWPADRHYWFGIAPRWSDTKGTKRECLGLTVVFVDVDYGSAGHKKKNRWKTRDEAQAAIDAFPIKPSIVVHTGGGFQVYWILSAPFIFENGNCGQVEAIMKGIGPAIGADDGTQDVSRIFRIPGTFNVKTDELRPVEMISCDPALVYDLADFAHYAAPALDQASPQDGPQTTNRDVLKSPEFKKMPAWLREIIVSGNAAAYNDDRSKRDHAVIGTLKRAGCNLNIIEAIFREHPVGDKFREKGNQGRKYLQYSFDKDSAIVPKNSTVAGAGDELDSHIARLNRNHAVAMIGGKCAVLNLGKDSNGRHDVTFSSVNDFKNYQANNRVWINTTDGKDKSLAVSQIWMESPKRRQYPAGVVFSPGKETPGAYNLWRGFTTAPAPGDWSLYREHMLTNICAGNELLFNYLFDWMARNVQDPGGERPGVAVVLKSTDFGTGKGVFTTQYGAIYGPHFQHITNGVQLLGKFNSHLKDCLLCFVDEGVWGGDKQAAGVLKGLITEKIMMIEPKGINAFPVENHMSLIIASNNDWVVPAGFDERRFLVLDVSPAKKQDTAYFGAIVDQMNKGGRAGMLHDLLERKITADLRMAPRTSALFDQVVNGMTTPQKFWLERLRNWNEHSWPEFVLCEHLYQDYLDFATVCGDRFKLIDRQFGRELRRLCPTIKRGRKRIGKGLYWISYMPSLDLCRTYFEKAVGVGIDWKSEQDDEDTNE